jgi:hypothetical protein
MTKSYGNQDRSFGADFFSTAFIKALRQFVVIRECCTRLYNDNGINFRDTEQELREMFRAAPNFYEGCRSELDKGVIVWIFISPSAPSLEDYGKPIKPTKYHLCRVIGDVY